jgi:hypothetical protein
MPKIANYLGKTIFVSLPTLHGDGPPLPFTLVGVEDCGLWLENDQADCFAGTNSERPVMVPFAQIAYVAFGTPPPAPRPGETGKETATSTRSKEDKQLPDARRKG